MGKRIVLLIDEVEQIAVIEKKEPGFIDSFRNSIESLKNIQFIMAASPHFKKIVAQSHYPCSTFLATFEIDLLPIMTNEEISQLMHNLVPEIREEEKNQILQYTH